MIYKQTTQNETFNTNITCRHRRQDWAHMGGKWGPKNGAHREG